jgi:uncharacterized protein (DUF1697 family)
MKELKTWLEELGLSNVATYLNSGNALFESELDKIDLVQLIEDTIYQKCKQRIPILIKAAPEMLSIVKAIPDDWQNDKTQQTYVAFLFEDIANENFLDDLPIKKQYLEIKHVHEVLIWNIKKENYNKSRIAKLVSHSSYRKMTTRNVNTTRKLADMCRDL